MHRNSVMSSTTALATGKVSKQRNQLIGLCYDVSGRPLHWPRNSKCAVKSLFMFSVHVVYRVVIKTEYSDT